MPSRTGPWLCEERYFQTSPDVKVLARFENGDPALFEKRRGQGRLLVLTSGWNPDESQLALSSKFVPLLLGILEENDGASGFSYYHINDRVRLPVAVGFGPSVIGPFGSAAQWTVQKPDGSEVKLSTDTLTFDGTDLPGIYQLAEGENRWPFAVNLEPAESRTTPLAVEDLEQQGVRLGIQEDDSDRRRQLRDLELESRQKLWRWIIALALGVLILETCLAGYLARPARAAAARAARTCPKRGVRIGKNQTLVGSIDKRTGKIVEGPYSSDVKSHRDLIGPEGSEKFTVTRGPGDEWRVSGSGQKLKLSPEAQRLLERQIENID